MAVWEVRVVFTNGDRHWENVWHIDVGSADDVPAGVIDALRDFHLGRLLGIYTLEKIVRRPAGTSDAFIEALFNLAGTRTVSSGDALPLFNTVRALLSGGVGRPGIKFLRGFLVTSDLVDNAGTINSTTVAGITAALIDLIDAVDAASCTIVFGSALRVALSAATQAVAQMRQQHRKRRRSAP